MPAIPPTPPGEIDDKVKEGLNKYSPRERGLSRGWSDDCDYVYHGRRTRFLQIVQRPQHGCVEEPFQDEKSAAGFRRQKLMAGQQLGLQKVWHVKRKGRSERGRVMEGDPVHGRSLRLEIEARDVGLSSCGADKEAPSTERWGC